MLQLFQTKKNHDVIDLSYFSRAQQTDIKRLFARVFSSGEGKKVLDYLQYITLYRPLSADVSDDHLRFREGQRALVANILQMIERGKQE